MYLNKLWSDATDKLKKDKSKFKSNEVFAIGVLIGGFKETISDGIIEQIIKDVTVYKKYDAIAMWVGDGGLIEYEPDFIIALVSLFGVTE